MNIYQGELFGSSKRKISSPVKGKPEKKGNIFCKVEEIFHMLPKQL